MFGRGKFQVGVLIEPKSEYGFDPEDQLKLERFRNMIWLVAYHVVSLTFMNVMLSWIWDTQAFGGAYECAGTSAWSVVQRGEDFGVV